MRKRFVMLIGLFGAAVGLLALVGLPNLTRPEFGFAFLLAIAGTTHWLLKKAPGHYNSPRCHSCGRHLRS